ncbi:MAG: PP2C family protein-serine/threonine phosphatase [Chloroflexota bacterium]
MPTVTPQNNKTQFKKIAEAFIRNGASSVCLYEKTRLLDKFPADIQPAGPYIFSGSKDGVYLQLGGLTGEIWQSIADTAFDLFSNLLKGETELESLTAALVETQDRLVSIYDLSKANRLTLDINALLEMLVKESHFLLNVECTFAYLVRENQEPVLYKTGETQISTDQINKLISTYKESPQKNIFKKVDHIDRTIHNLMIVTIPVIEDVFAVMGSVNKSSDFSSPDLKLAKALSVNSGAQLENALLIQDALARTRLETEMNLANQVQTALLPQSIPQFKGLDVFADSHPAREVGGDFYDIVSSEAHPMIFLLGDVTGKGMAAAMLMSMTRTVAKSAGKNMPFEEPHQLMIRINNDMHDDFSRVGMFTTAFIGLLDRELRTFSYCNAGQSPIVFAPAGKKPVIVEADDIPVGIFEGYQYSSKSVKASPGDIFILASDGFPESMNPEGEMYGYKKILELVDKVRDLPAKEIVEALIDDVNQFSGNHPQDDDRTILLIKII